MSHESRFLIVMVGLFTVACAPSLPRTAGKARDAAAGADLAASGDAVAEARSDGRAPAPAPAPGADAASAELAAEGRGAGDGAGGGDAPDPPGGDAGQDAGGGDVVAYDGKPPVQPRAGELAIVELLVNPAGTDTNREWVEVVNSTALALDLRTLHVADAANEIAVDAGILAPEGLLVLGQSTDAAKNGGAPVGFSFGNTISLNNGGDSISLCLGPCADGVVLAAVSWGADLGAAAYDGHAAMVVPGGGGFCPADQPFGTAGSFGTPGAPNPPCPN
jgi:hypothetical protein